MKRGVVVSLLATCFAVGCGPVGEAPVSPEIEPTLPAGEPTDLLAGVVSYDIHQEGDHLVVLAAVRRDKVKAELVCLRSGDAGATWSEPVSVAQNQAGPHMPSHHNAPQIAGIADDLVAAWTTTGSGFMGRGPLATAVSSDGGASWEPGPAPVPRADAGGQAFVDMAAGADGTLHLVWLGKRDGPEAPKGMYHVSSEDRGLTWSRPLAIDSATCECCSNRIALDGAGSLYAIYRDLNPRDMSVAKMNLGQREWRRLGYAGSFDWQFDGCPHVGGGIHLVRTPEATEIHTTVWTGKDGASGAYYVRSRNGGKSWEDPVLMGEGHTMHGDVTGSDSGVLLRSWDSLREEGSAVYAALSRDGGDGWTDPLRVSAEGENATHPVARPVRGGFRAFWVASGADRKDHLRTRLVSGVEWTLR